ncbi:MAG: rRNA maturation RNase YbeY [Polyangiaceae bacterium]|nr:rRNA maturation RNase YbeY [Polyangiaceae bacterium]
MPAVVQTSRPLVALAGVTAVEVRRRAEKMLDRLGLGPRELSVLLTDDRRIHQLNRDYRSKDRPTDVLAFAMDEGDGRGADELLGDVVISLETAARQAAERGREPLDEVTHLLAHGVLHLVGYDHQTDAEHRAMERMARVMRAVATSGEPKAASKRAVKGAPLVSKRVAKGASLVSKRVAKEAPAASKRVAKEAPAASKRVAKEAPAASKRVAKEAPAVSKRVAKGLPLVSKRAVKGAPAASTRAAKAEPPALPRAVRKAPSASQRDAKKEPSLPSRAVQKAPPVSSRAAKKALTASSRGERSTRLASKRGTKGARAASVRARKKA